MLQVIRTFKVYHWIGLSLFMISALWFTASAGHRLYLYGKLSASTSPLSIEWSTREISDEKYFPLARYTFQVENHIYHGEQLFETKTFRNRWAAKMALEHHLKLPWSAYYDPSNPEYSALQKTFPTKEFLSALALWGLSIYFVGLIYFTQTKLKK